MIIFTAFNTFTETGEARSYPRHTHSSTAMYVTPRLAQLLLLSTILLKVLQLPAQAQVTAVGGDANTVVTHNGNTFDITGGTTAGSNLFQSFQRFGLNADQVANFRSSPAIQNILGRVVGGDASIINGLIRVTGSNANLYLMNPAGIVFGANARLDVAGSFTATTANGIGFGDRWLNATGANNYAALVGDPGSFAFTMPQPGAIVNAGNLAVGTGQSLTLLGGTIINTGTLTAPEGTITIAAIPGEKLVRLTQTGSLLSLDLPVETKAALNPQPFSPLTLPELLTGGNLSGATGVTADNGIVKLTGSGIQIKTGDVVAKNVTAQTATLSASNNLILVESQINTANDLNLLAQNTVQVRDSATNPVVLQSGGKLLIQGNQAVDIFALNHPNSGFASGGDMTLRSANPITGDAHYFTGGSLRFEQLNGSPGNVFSPNDPIVLALSDVTLGAYTGASLHILAGGSVTLGAVTINAIGTGTETINLGRTGDSFNSNPIDTTNLVNGYTTPINSFASLAPITRADGSLLTFNGTPVIDSNGNVQRLNPTVLIIDGSVRPTLDIRAGINWTALGGLPTNRIIPTPLPSAPVSPPQPNFSAPPSTPSSADITVGSIQINGQSTILLTNQYAPNATLVGGTIRVNGTPIEGISDAKFSNANINADGSFDAQNVVVIDSRNSIIVGNIIARPNSVYLAAVGNIVTGHIAALRPSSSDATSVFLSSTTGNITVKTIDAGANGIDIRAGGLFQVTDSFTESLGIRYFTLPPLGSSLRSLLDSKGITTINATDSVVSIDLSSAPSNAFPISIIARPDAPASRPSSPIGFTVLNAPVTIRYGDGSRTLINDRITVFEGSNVDTTTVQTPSLIRVQGGNAAFFGGPQQTATSTTTPANYTVSYQGNPILAERYEILPIPTNANGIVGAIVVAAGQDNGFYSSTQNRAFPAIIKPVDPVTPIDPVRPVDSVNPTNSGTGGFNVSQETAQNVQRQTNNAIQATCNPSSTIAAAPSTTTSGIETRSPRATTTSTTTASNPCASAPSDDAQILKILGE